MVSAKATAAASAAIVMSIGLAVTPRAGEILAVRILNPDLARSSRPPVPAGKHQQPGSGGCRQECFEQMRPPLVGRLCRRARGLVDFAF